MPRVWERFPETQFWFVGSDPPDHILELDKDKRVKVTGFVENVQEVLKTMTLVICPFSGEFGFRSRLIEIMALGVPVVATKDAAYGMGLKNGAGIFLANEDCDLAEACLTLMKDRCFLAEHSRLARLQIENKFSFELTYGKFPGAVLALLDKYETNSGVT
jgi:glycosyltransferase involved in cell wall biosynthesis